MNHRIIKTYLSMKETSKSNKQGIVEQYTTEILCEMLNVLTELKKANAEANRHLDSSLEISNNNNINLANKFLSSNVALLRDCLATAINETISDEEIKSYEQLDNTADRKFMIPLYLRLFNYFKTSVNPENFEDENSYLAHRYIKMLLEAKINGIYSKQFIVER